MDVHLDCYNQLLPEIERDSIVEDDADHLQKLKDAFIHLENNDSVTVDPIIFGKCLRLLHTRQRMKYSIPSDLKCRILKLLYSIFVQKKPTIMQKKSILNAMHSLCEKKPKLDGEFVFDWKVIWTEVRAIMTRSNKLECICNPNLTADFMSAATGFLHCARYLIDQQSAAEIVKEAMSLLVDVRSSVCYEGLLMLINCLPTNFEFYDEYLPQWVVIWSKLQYHQHWDCCWLTLFTRARKYATSFDWGSLSPFLISKARELIVYSKSSVQQLPFPSYYDSLLHIKDTGLNVCLNKLSKLLYFMTLIEAGQSHMLTSSSIIGVTPSTAASVLKISGDDFCYAGYANGIDIHKGAMELALFYQSCSWNYSLTVFTSSLIKEISSHFARNLAFFLAEKAITSISAAEAPSASSLNPDKARFQAPIHLPTVRYLMGLVTVAVTESIYHDSSGNGVCGTAVKNLLALDPSLMDHLIPYLIAPLLPEAVSQSHQTPVALQCLRVCLKSLLFPHPVLVWHLPTMLKVLLPGIDVNDRAKTTDSLNLVMSIVANVPIMSNYVGVCGSPAAASAPYFSQISALRSGNVGDPNTWVHNQLTECSCVLETLSEYWEEWLPLFLEKIFALFEAESAKQRGKTGCQLTQNIRRVMETVLAAIQCPYLLKLVLDTVLKYFSQALPTNAAKTAAQLMECIVARSPELLLDVLTVVLDLDKGGLCAVSAEKMAFRLRLAGGAVRRATASQVSQCLHLLQPYLETNQLHHAEKCVRKAVSKLAKDVLRGSCSIYQQYANKSSVCCFGIPALPSTETINWHIPDHNAVEAAIEFLKSKVETSMAETRQLLSQVKFQSISNEISQDFKKSEEVVATNLKFLSRLLRGAADMIPDDFRELTTDGDVGIHLPRTGQERVLALVKPESLEYLRSLRLQMLHFLSEVHDALVISPVALDLLSPSKFQGDSLLRLLSNSASVRSKWVKLLHVVQFVRMHSKHDIDSGIKELNNFYSIVRSKFTYTMYQELKRYDLPSTVIALSPNGQLRYEYWKWHDLSRRVLWRRVELQRAIMVKEYAKASLSLHLNNSEAPFTVALATCLHKMGELCRYDHDGVRASALKLSSFLHPTFDMQQFWMEEDVLPLMDTLTDSSLISFSTADELYGFVNGAIKLISRPFVLDIACKKWEFTKSFLLAVLNTSTLIIRVEDSHKREKLMVHLTEALVAYADRFNLVCSEYEFSEDGIEVMAASLRALGIDPVTGTPLPIAGPGVGASSGSRQEAHAAWILLHLIGHPNVPIIPAVATWTLQTLTSSMIRPALPLAEAVLLRLLHAHSAKGLPANVVGVFKAALLLPPASGPAPEPSLAENGIAALPEVSTPVSPSSQAAPKSKWTPLLLGLSLSMSTSNKSHWARGVDRLLGAASYLRCLGPRYLTSTFSEECRAWYHLASLVLWDDDSCSAVDDVSGRIQAILNVALALSHASEEERGAIECTRAQLFSGLYRFLLIKREFLGSGCAKAIESILCAFLAEQLERSGHDYTLDLTEGVFYALLDSPTESFDVQEGSIIAFALNGFKQVVLQSQSQQPIGVGPFENEGFVKHQKKLLLARMVVLAALKTNISFPGKERANVAEEIEAPFDFCMSVLRSPGLQAISRYGSVRKEFLLTANGLANWNADTPVDLSALHEHFINAHEDATANLETRMGPFSPLCSAMSNMQLSSAKNPKSVSMFSDDVLSEVTATATAAVTAEPLSISLQSGNARLKTVLECTCLWIDIQMEQLPLWKCDAWLDAYLGVLLPGAAHPDLQVGVKCQDAAMNMCRDLWPRAHVSQGGQHLYTRMIDVLLIHATHPSAQVRRTVAGCIASLQSVGWTHISADDRTRIKNMLLQFMLDDKPEVAEEGVKWMTAYLQRKTQLELGELARVFIANSEAFVKREKKKSAVLSPPKPDKDYLTTFMMMTCLIRTYSCDMPPFMPALISAYLRHRNVSSLREIVTRTIRDFRSSHQDRWEEFKHNFTTEQLDELQGAGAAHYFS